MTYGLEKALFLEHGPTVTAASARGNRSSAAYRAWDALSQECRLSLVESALRPPANDLVDAFPLAL